ncbi:MAG: CHAD domain-containing protein [Paludibacter sp.]|nr:CHAD domain-containing protein [Paludibacter sp.]
MNAIIRDYDLLVDKYHEIEEKSTINEVHDKRVILRRIFSILVVYKINPAKLKNGEKAFKLFGKLRDIQVQISKLESASQTQELVEYFAFLKQQELKLNEKVRKFGKKKQLQFPKIKKKGEVDKSKILSKVNKSFTKLVKQVQLEDIFDADDIHQIRIRFKKFRYLVEILACVERIDKVKLDKLKIYQDQLGEIQDYEILINGIKRYCQHKKLVEEIDTEVFEMSQNTLIESFDGEIESFIEVCRSIIQNNSDAISLSSVSKGV